MPDHRAADRFVQEHLHLAFSWRSNNCVTFAAGFVRAYHGVDLLGAEGRPEDLRSAIREVATYGSLSAAATSRLGPPVDPRLAAYGDLVLVEGTEGVGDSLGVCVGPSVLAPGEAGLVRLPMSQAKHAWKTAPKP